MIYLVTHGERFLGHDPCHTQKGIEQIREISLKSITSPVPLVLIGTGRRFQEVYQILSPQLIEVPVQPSPFLGTADGLEMKDGVRVVVTSGGMTYPLDKYIGIKGSPAFNPWQFVKGFSPNTVLCSGGELMSALTGKPGEKGSLYTLDPSNKSIKKI